MSTQFYKSIYFSDCPSANKSITIAFTKKDTHLFKYIENHSNEEIREFININSYHKLISLSKKEDRPINQIIKRKLYNHLVDSTKKKIKDVTFIGSKNLPFQRWYPFIEGYSPDFVKLLIKTYDIKNTLIYDPFAGTGTTIFAADENNLSTVYSEVNPLLQYLIETKIKVLKATDSEREKLSHAITSIEKSILNNLDNYEEDKSLKETYKLIFSESIYFPEETLSKILKLRSFIDTIKLEDELLANALTIAAISCLVAISYLKKSGDVRFKTQKEIDTELKSFIDIFPQKLSIIAEDVHNLNFALNKSHEFILSNAKNISKINDIKVGAIITSPPYLNGTNYFRNTKLELWFMRYLQYENDLRYFRDQALTSGINDVKKEYSQINDVDITTKSKVLKKTLSNLYSNAYDSRIPIMAKSYFEEMYRLFRDTKKHLLNNAKILIDIGDSIFSNVHIKTDIILIELLEELGYNLIDHKLLRKRRSRNKEILSQSLIAFNFISEEEKQVNQFVPFIWQKEWNNFKKYLPHQQTPYSKRNWGHGNHSLCSYQGKLKPAIAHHLIKTFVPENGSILDPFSGVGTIPFEAALSGKTSFGIDISLPAYYISQAKVSKPIILECHSYIEKLNKYIKNNQCTEEDLEKIKSFGFNKTLDQYYEKNTLREVMLARKFIKYYYPKTPSEMMVVSCLLHILHGNRPYALSRNSHPIIPYAPTGEYVYKNLIKNVTDKVEKACNQEFPNIFKPGKIFNLDSTMIWPQEINNLDAIVTSPPFFDSTRFYLANWIRIWFSGWSEKDFKYQPNSFVEEKQKIDFSVYEPIFRQAKERLKKDGIFVLHLGKSIKCDMAEELQRVSKRWFNTVDLFSENVEHCESYGIRDKGTVTAHQYLILI